MICLFDGFGEVFGERDGEVFELCCEALGERQLGLKSTKAGNSPDRDHSCSAWDSKS